MMKISSVLFLMLFGAGAAHAHQPCPSGCNPNQIQELQSSFRQASVPNPTNLRVGKNWTCFHYVVNGSGYSFRHPNEFKFKSTNDPFYFFNDSFDPSWKTVEGFVFKYDALKSKYVEFIGYSRTGDQTQYVRVMPDGKLIVERTSPSGYLPAITESCAPDDKVVAYQICNTQW